MANSINDAIKDLSTGNIIMVTDDDDREGEGDLLIAACFCTAEKLAFIIRNTCGIICVPITTEYANRLNLEPMVRKNNSYQTTAFTVSIDYKHNLTTGISAAERAATCKAIANPKTNSDDFVRPGHIFPLIAKEGGVLIRSGHTEAAIDLCKLANLPPVGVICELVNDDGTVMKGKQLTEFTKKYNIKHITISQLINYRQSQEILIKKITTFKCNSPIGQLNGYTYASLIDPSYHHVAFVYGDIKDGQNIPVCFHKLNITVDLFYGSEKVNNALKIFQKEKMGILIFFKDGAVGVPVKPLVNDISLENKRKKLWREIGIGAQILKNLNVSSIMNLSLTPEIYFAGLEGFDIKIIKNIKI